MATSSQALARAGLIDPTKPGSYPVVLGDDIRRSNGNSDRVFTGIRYNFKPKHLTDKTTQKTSTLTANGDGDFDVTFRDNSGGRYIFAGKRVTKGGKYVLVFDSKARKFILHRLDSLFVMNMTDTPTDHDTDALKKKHPYIDALSKRPRPRGNTPLARRPVMKKAPGGPLRPMPKSTARPASKPTVLRSTNDIKKKEKRPASGVTAQESESETKAAKDVREQREAIIVKDATSKNRAVALAARTKDGNKPKESSKLSREHRASPDGKSTDYGSGDDYKSRSIDVKSFKDTESTPAKSKLGKSTPSKGAAKDAVKDTVRVATKKDSAGKAGTTSTPRGKDGGKTGKAAGKPKPSAPVSLPMPSAPAPEPKAAPKKKRQEWEEEEEEEEEDDNFGLVIEYPEGRGTSSRNHASSSTPQLHMTTFAEFANGGDGDGDDEDDGFWDPTQDDKNTVSAPASGAGKGSKPNQAQADDMEEVDLEAELEEEFKNAGNDVDAALEAELEAEFFAAESESEISEEE